VKVRVIPGHRGTYEHGPDMHGCGATENLEKTVFIGSGFGPGAAPERQQ